MQGHWDSYYPPTPRDHGFHSKMSSFPRTWMAPSHLISFQSADYLICQAKTRDKNTQRIAIIERFVIKVYYFYGLLSSFYRLHITNRMEIWIKGYKAKFTYGGRMLFNNWNLICLKGAARFLLLLFFRKTENCDLSSSPARRHDSHQESTTKVDNNHFNYGEISIETYEHRELFFSCCCVPQCKHSSKTSTPLLGGNVINLIICLCLMDEDLLGIVWNII